MHLRGARSGNDFAISWIRRTRVGGDGWTATEVPLSESSEAYEIDVLNGSTVVRTLSSSVTEVGYSAAQQIADFGAVQSAISVRVYQLSASFGRGSSRSAIL